MNSVKWLLEPEVFDEDEDSVIAALKKLAVPHVVCKFGRDYASYIKDFAEEDCVVFHGSFQFARQVEQTAKWIPGVYCNKQKLDCLYYYPRIGKHLLNSHYMMLPFGELNRRKNELFDFAGFGPGEPAPVVFIRPSSGLKSFTGKVVMEENWDKDVKLMAFYDVLPEALVVAASAYQINHEWRTVVVDGKVVAAAQYKKGNDFCRITGAPSEVMQYAQQVVDETKFDPDPAWTLDICDVNKELKVVEVGSLSCAGFYGADPELIIPAVNAVALKEWESYQ